MPRLRSGGRAKLAPGAGIETGAEAGQPRVGLGKVGGVTAEQGGEVAQDETQGEVMSETMAGAGAGQMVVWKGTKEQGSHNRTGPGCTNLAIPRASSIRIP